MVAMVANSPIFDHVNYAFGQLPGFLCLVGVFHVPRDVSAIVCYAILYLIHLLEPDLRLVCLLAARAVRLQGTLEEGSEALLDGYLLRQGGTGSCS